MRILFDQGTPVPLRCALPGHAVATVHDLGWSTLPDGPPLAAAEQVGYEVFVATDQQLKHQQHLPGRCRAILVLGSTAWPRLAPHTEAIGRLVGQLVAVDYREFPIP